MNRAILTSFTILCLLSVLFPVGCKISVKADTDITYVVPEDFPTIQEAINYAYSGDTIFVRKGIYYEHVIVNNSVCLVGEDRELTIVDGNETGCVISITADNVSIEGFTIRGSGRSVYDRGIFVDHSTGNRISHNIISNNYDGIALCSSSNNLISGNTITNNNYDGIYLYSSSNNLISGNTITNNNYDGIYLYSSSNNLISGNTITNNNYDGIALCSSSNNLISGNTITNNNYDGIYLYSSSNNLISGNTITNNNYGMYFAFYSSNNTIYCNNFNNTRQVWSDLLNIWYYRHKGNYWSDYTGQDLNGDGIGDDPHVIDERNQDNYPLMGIFSDFSIVFKGETYHVATVCNSTISEFKFEIGLETGNRIIQFNAKGKDGTVGFCRVTIPSELMNYPYVVLVGTEKITPTLLDASNEKYLCLYFTYAHNGNTVTIISSEMLHLYNELLDKYSKLQIDLYDLNNSYQEHLNNYSTLIQKYTQLQDSYRELDNSYQEHLNNYSTLIQKYTQLQDSYRELDNSYQEHLNNYSTLIQKYTQLQDSYRELDNSYQEHLMDYSKNVCNIRNLMYIFAFVAGIFIITTVYLSKHMYVDKS